MQTTSTRSLAFTTAVAALALLLAAIVPGAARNVRGGAHVNVHPKVSAPRNVHVNKNVNINRNVNVRAPAYRPTHVNVDVRRGYPVARGVAVGTAAAVTAAAIGSMVYALPSGCRHTQINGVWYYTCGNVWYEERYSGSQVAYVVVNPPR